MNTAPKRLKMMALPFLSMILLVAAGAVRWGAEERKDSPCKPIPSSRVSISERSALEPPEEPISLPLEGSNRDDTNPRGKETAATTIAPLQAPRECSQLQSWLLSLPDDAFRHIAKSEELDAYVTEVCSTLNQGEGRTQKEASVEVGLFLENINRRVESTRR